MIKKALYAGSFDPITNGHLDLITRASELYDELVVGIITNPAKKALFSVEEKKEMIRQVTTDIPNVAVEEFDGLLASYVNKREFDVVIRGLRATVDFEYEIQMAQMNARLFNRKVETIFLMTSPEYSFISSSIIKEVFLLGGDVSGLVPPCILKFMAAKISK